MAGPPVVERAFATPVGKEELGGVDIHGANGTVDNVVDSEREPIDDAVSKSAIANAGARTTIGVELSGHHTRGVAASRAGVPARLGRVRRRRKWHESEPREQWRGGR